MLCDSPRTVPATLIEDELIEKRLGLLCMTQACIVFRSTVYFASRGAALKLRTRIQRREHGLVIGRLVNSQTRHNHGNWVRKLRSDVPRVSMMSNT